MTTIITFSHEVELPKYDHVNKNCMHAWTEPTSSHMISMQKIPYKSQSNSAITDTLSDHKTDREKNFMMNAYDYCFDILFASSIHVTGHCLF